MRNTTNNTWITKIIACIVVLCFGAATFFTCILVFGQNNRISELERKIENKTLTSQDITAVAEGEGITRDEVLQIVATYIEENKLDYSKFVTRDEVAEMIANAIAAYDKTRFDSNGHCLCCEGGNHVSTQYIDRTKTEVIDNTKTEVIDNTKTEVIDRTVTNYVENPFDASGYYTREQVDALIREALASQVNNTIPETDPEDQNTVVNFIEADEGFQGEVNGETTVTEPAAGEQGVAASENPGFVDPSEGFQGEVSGETTVTEPATGEQGTASEETPIFVEPSDGEQGTASEETTENNETTGQIIDLRTGTQGTANDDSNGSFNGPSEGFEGNTDGNVGDGFNPPAAGEQGNANSESYENTDADEGFENGTSDGGQVIDLRGTANNEPVVEVVEPVVEFDNTDELPAGFVMPGEGEGING